MEKQKVYLETSLFNFYIDGSKGNDHINTVKLFEEIAAGKYEAFTSTYVTDELERARKDKRDKMLNLITEYNIAVLAESGEAARLADIYAEEGVIPRKYRTDGLHIAIAAVNELDTIVSMNLRHIVKQKTIRMTTHINESNGYRAVSICSPGRL
jgi:predicted nucleic acid-binding protein